MPTSSRPADVPTTSCEPRSPRLANDATEQVLAGGAIDAQTHNDLIEAFIQKVGASA